MKYKVGDILTSKLRPGEVRFVITEINDEYYTFELLAHHSPEFWKVGEIITHYKDELEDGARLLTKLERALK